MEAWRAVSFEGAGGRDAGAVTVGVVVFCLEAFGEAVSLFDCLDA
jgi:hypothetical protein